MRVILVFFYVTLAYLVGNGQSTCTCDEYEVTSRQFRMARDAGDVPEAERLAFGLMEQSNPYCMAMGVNLLSNARLAASQLEEAMVLIQRQKKLLDSLACDSQQYLEYYLTKSSYHYAIDQYDSSIANSLKALAIAEETNFVTRQITLRLGIGSAFYRTGQPEKKMEYARSIIPLIEQVQDSSYSCQFYFNLFGAYYSYYKTKREQPAYLDSAAMYNSKALSIARKTMNKRFLPYCYEALEIINNEKGGSNQSGLAYLDSALLYGRSAMSKGQISELLLNKAGLFLKAGNKKQAMIYADSALFFAAQNSQKSVYASHLEDASMLYSELGDFQKALSLHRQADIIADSLKSTANARIVRELEEKYNKEKNERTIEQLSQEGEINQLQIKLLVFSILLAIIVIALIIFGYRLSLLKQRKEAMESKYRLNQALINPHFLSNALVSIQRFILENNTTDASGFLSKFSRLMRQLLESAHMDMISVEEEIELIRNYLDMQKLRFKDAFGFELHIADNIDTSQLFIAPMFVQPFVENAIEHGINEVEKGRIDIYYELIAGRLSITILDNGKGLSATSDNHHKSLSTGIIKERIDLLNKTSREKITLRIENRKDAAGAQVILTLPVHDGHHFGS